MKSLICPQCGANLSLDDTRDFGFCQYCGAKVMLHETIEIKHSGTVKFDTSEQEVNFLKLANSAYSAENYSEAYSYYSKVLELNPGHIAAMYLKGVCAVLISQPQSIRTNEYVQALTQAKREAAGNDKNQKLLVDLEKYSIGMLTYWINHGLPKQPISEEEKDCVCEFIKATEVVILIQKVVSLIENDTYKENLIESGVDFISKVRKTNLDIFIGNTIDRKGRIVANYQNCALQPQQKQVIDEIDTYLRNTYNNMPERVAKANDINASIEEVDNNINQLQDTLKEKNKQRFAIFKDYIKNRKDPTKKAALDNIDQEINSLNSQLKDWKNRKKEVLNTSKEFNKTLL